MQFTHRAFEAPRDYAPLRLLLSNAYEADPTPWNWPTVRLDSLRYGGHWRSELEGKHPWAGRYHLWERPGDEGPQTIAVAHPDGDHQVWFELLPALRNESETRYMLESAMLEWFAAYNRPPTTDQQVRLECLVYRHDSLRQRLLVDRGWVNTGPCDVTRWMALEELPEVAPVPSGYTVRPLALDNPAELEAQAAITNLVFPRAEFEAATWHVLANAPTWNESWVVTAPDGALASFCAIWYDAAARAGWFEPVGTHPAHRRRGLASAMMTTSLQRLAAMGAKHVYVDTGYDMEANRLYEKVGFARAEVLERWLEPEARSLA